MAAISEIPLKQLQRMLEAAIRAAGPDSQSAQFLRRAVEDREQRERPSKPEGSSQ